MAVRYSRVLGAVALSAPCVMDRLANPFSVGFVVEVSAGATLTYSVVHSYDDPFAAGFVPASAVVINHPTVNGQTATKDGNYAFPVSWIALNVTAWTSGTATLIINQSGNHA